MVAPFVVLIFSVLLVIFDMEIMLVGIPVGIIMFSIPLNHKNLFHNNGFGGKFFFTRAGYALLGISFGLIILGTTFNMAYEGGFFDFTDFIFCFIGQPLVSLIKFDFDNENLMSRLMLYGLVVVNLATITWIIDLVIFFLIKIYLLIFPNLFRK